MGKQATDGGTSGPYPRLRSVGIKGYRPFRDFSAELGSLEVIAGANGSGKSALFEFMRFLRDGMENEIPRGIVPGYAGQQAFHVPGPQELSWDVRVDAGEAGLMGYTAGLVGPVGQLQITEEHIRGTSSPDGPLPPATQLHRRGASRRLSLNRAFGPEDSPMYELREFIRLWTFYDPHEFSRRAMRTPVLVEQEPALQEDASNLSSILHYLMTEHPAVFDEVQQQLQTLLPSFKGMQVKAYGAPGQVMTLWKEGRAKSDLTLADLSDGTLSLICWTVLCTQPDPPPLICIDEPELGLHPRTLPVLAALFDRASERTQIVLATHSSYFLTQFDIGRIAVMRKENGEAKFAKPQDSKALTGMLEEFGPDEIEAMHRSDELEFLA